MLGFAQKGTEAVNPNVAPPVNPNPAGTTGVDTNSVDGQAEGAMADGQKSEKEAQPQLQWNSPQYGNYR